VSLTFGSLFSGIGGIDLGLERAGMRVKWQCEIDPFCRKVLAKYWPGVLQYKDVRRLNGGICVDLICGGFPCQPVSVAGKRKGTSDDRWLWPEFDRIISAIKPKIVLIENVPGLRTKGLNIVLNDLNELGFNAEWSNFRASEIGAPHLRNRLYIVATHPDRIKLRDEPGWLSRAFDSAVQAVNSEDIQSCLTTTDPDSVRRWQQAWKFANLRGWSDHCGWRFNPDAGMDDGVPGTLGRCRKALGNAVVVPVIEMIGKTILEVVE